MVAQFSQASVPLAIVKMNKLTTNNNQVTR